MSENAYVKIPESIKTIMTQTFTSRGNACLTYVCNTVARIAVGSAITSQAIHSYSHVTRSGRDAVSRFAQWWSRDTPGVKKLCAQTITLADDAEEMDSLRYPVGMFALVSKEYIVIGCLSIERTDRGLCHEVVFHTPRVHADKIRNLLKSFAVLDKAFIECTVPSRWGDPTNTTTQARPWESIAMNRALRTKLETFIETFDASKEQYDRCGIPYRAVIALTGYPGCGKTSIVRGLATKYRKPLVVMPTNVIFSSPELNSDEVTFDGQKFSEFMQAAPDHALISIEDFPTHVVRSRANVSPEEARKHQAVLSNVLGAFDGVTVPYGKIIILTMNEDLKDADPAFTRSERVNEIIEIPRLTGEDVEDLLSFLYQRPVKLPEKMDTIPWSGNDIQTSWRRNPGSPDAAIRSLLEAAAKKTVIDIPAEGV